MSGKVILKSKYSQVPNQKYDGMDMRVRKLELSSLEGLKNTQDI